MHYCMIAFDDQLNKHFNYKFSTGFLQAKFPFSTPARSVGSVIPFTEIGGYGLTAK